MSCHVCCTTIHLSWIFATECASPMSSPATIGIHNNLSTGKTGIGMWTAFNKTSRRVHEVLTAIIIQFARQYRSHHFLQHKCLDSILCHFRAMLIRHDDGMNLLRPSILILHGNLALSVWPKPWCFTLLTYLRKTIDNTVGQSNRQRHEFFCLITCKTKHETLVTGSSRFSFFGIIIHGIADIL